VTTHVTFCRICNASCGLLVDVADGRVIDVRGDRDNPLSRGFTCPKGRHYGSLHHDPERVIWAKKRNEEGTFVDISTSGAIAEIAERLASIIEQHGPASVAMFVGTQTYFNALTLPLALSWFGALGSPKLFSTMTIDQSAKWVAAKRMGYWHAGVHAFAESDVCLLVGTNPLVTLQATTGFPTADPLARLREARDRGMQLVVIDPRRTETARHADLHLQPLPGRDPLLLAAMLHVILEEELHDESFCAQHVNGLADLRGAVGTVTPAEAASGADVPVEDIVRAARIFGSARRGFAAGGTGPDMAPWSNLAEHLISALNAVCGRFLRAGDRIQNPGVLQARPPLQAMVVPPDREWERGFRSRVRGLGTLNGELPSGVLADEILAPGEDRVRALVVSGGNPAAALPDQERAVKALGSLDLLVTLDPRMSETARLAHYVIPPALGLERPDTTWMELTFPAPFAQYTAPVLAPPGDVVEDWVFYWSLATAMGLQLSLGPMDLDMSRQPTSDELLGMFAGAGHVPLDAVKANPHGKLYDVPAQFVEARAADEPVYRLELFPDDVRDEFESAIQATRDPQDDQWTHLLVVRRMRDVINSFGRGVPPLDRVGHNPAWLHPDDLAHLGLSPGQLITIESSHGRIEAVVQPDDTVRPGVLAMSHCWGGLPGSDLPVREAGANTGRLVGTQAHVVESINAMPRLTAIPVRVTLADLRPG
jgi:anaerobic selenocysteine-containing dehydrogenase